jgi:hypothetical protein
MKWSSNGLFEKLAADNLGFGLALSEICQIFLARNIAKRA